MATLDDISWLQNWLPAIRVSEQRVVETVCKKIDYGEYTVFQSSRFPYFYGGNGIRIFPNVEILPLTKWVKIFNIHFDPEIYRHTLIVLPGQEWSAEAEAEAHASDLRVFNEVLMAVRSEALSKSARNRTENGLLAYVISTSEAAAGLYRLHLEESQHADWFKDEADFKLLFNKTIAIAKGTGTSWLVIQDPDNKDRYAAALGFFFCEGICRLQEVITAPSRRRLGLATVLLASVAVHAMEAGCPVVGLLADPDSDAHHLYEKLGFVDLEVDVSLMRY